MANQDLLDKCLDEVCAHTTCDRDWARDLVGSIIDYAMTGETGEFDPDRSYVGYEHEVVMETGLFLDDCEELPRSPEVRRRFFEILEAGSEES